MTDRELLDLLLTKVTAIETNVADLKTDVADIKASVNRIEEGQPQEVLAMLKVISAKVTDLHENQSATFTVIGKHEVQLASLRKSSL